MYRSLLLCRYAGLMLLCCLAPPVWSGPEDAAARALAQRVFERPVGKDSVQRARMILSQPGRQTRERELYILYARARPGESKTLVRFSTPPDVAGTTLLTYDHLDRDSDQWLYLPALKRERRISGSRKGGQFVGSDLYYEDLQEREPGQDRHQLQGRGKVGGVDCDILVSTPLKPGSSVYLKRVSWIDGRTLIPLQVEFYEKSPNAPSKRLRAQRIQKVQGYWTVMESTMSDLSGGHETRMRVNAIRYDQGLGERLFTQQALADPGLATPYLP